MSRNKQPKVSTSPVVRGLRNNNPGNIRITRNDKGAKTYWIGEVDGQDSSFKTFKSMPYGFRAMFVTLNSYFNKGFDTIEKIVSRYAPASDNNDTSAYIVAVQSKTGINAKQRLQFSDVENIKKIVGAMARVELGIEPDKSLIEKGYELFKT